MALPVPCRLGRFKWPDEKECRDLLGMGPVLLWLRHCWQEHAGPEGAAGGPEEANGYGRLHCLRTCRLKPVVLFTWARDVRSTM